MPSDFAVSRKTTFSTFARAFALEMSEIGLPLQDISGGVSRFSPIYRKKIGPQRGQIRSKRKNNVFFDPIPIAIIFTLFGPKTCRRWFLATGNSPLIDLGENPDTFRMRREIPIFNISGAKTHANVLKETFLTDCKSDVIRIGLRTHEWVHKNIRTPHKCVFWVPGTGRYTKKKS